MSSRQELETRTPSWLAIAETKDHLDWELLSKCVEQLSASQAKALKSAVDTVEDQEDEHLDHSKGWRREL